MYFPTSILRERTEFRILKRREMCVAVMLYVRCLVINFTF